MKEMIGCIVKSLLITILIVAVLFGIAYAGITIEGNHDSKLYNNGKCNYCEKGQYHLLNVQRGKQSKMYFFYECDNCHWVIETTTNMEVGME